MPTSNYIDAGHEFKEVYADIVDFWAVLRPDGIIFGDEYWSTWPGVIEAVNRFAFEHKLALETNADKWFFRKPS